MSQQTLTALSQRDEAFWVGLGLLLVGSVLSAGTPPTDVGPGTVLGTLGGLIIVTRVLVAVWHILRTTVAAGRFGYAEVVADDTAPADDDERTTLTE